MYSILIIQIRYKNGFNNSYQHTAGIVCFAKYIKKKPIRMVDRYTPTQCHDHQDICAK